ncbi:radical SAM protein [Candidatus Pacearchaeota archaeon]|nr:radical SAM protein [Candidatus Pacearchaeota archaeon]
MGKSLKGILWEMPRGKPGWSEKSVVIPSAGSGEVARYAYLNGKHDVYIADLNCARGGLKQRIDEGFKLFSERTSQEKPDFFMLTGMTCKADNNARFAKYLKKRFEDVPIIFGGAHVSGVRAGIEMANRFNIYDGGTKYAFQKLADAGIDFLYSGEAINFGNLLNAIKENSSERDIQKIKGVSKNVGGKWHHNSRHLDSLLEVPQEISLKESPMWKNWLFDFNKTHLWGMGPAFPFRISKGCNYSCHFCSAMAVNPKEGFKTHIPYTPLDFKHSLSEFRKLLEMNAGFIFFTDENPLQKDRAGNSFGRKFLEEIARRGWAKKVKLGMMTSAKATANEREVELMKKANVVMAMVGYESLTNPRALGKTNVTCKMAEKSIKNLHDAGIMVFDGAIVGGFEDGREDIMTEIGIRSELGLGVTLTQPLQPYFGTLTRIKAIEKSLIRNNGRSDNESGGFGGMHGEIIASLATEKGLEPLDVSEAIIAAQRENSLRNLKNVISGPFGKKIPLHLIGKFLRAIPNISEEIGKRKLDDREIAKKRIKEIIKYNQIDFS